MPSSLALGAPGVYTVAPEPSRRLRAVPLDACAFVGLSPRGPAWEPVLDDLGSRLEVPADQPYPVRRSVPRLVHSWEEYRWLYGDDDGSTYLARSVAAFFRQGGRRAWIVRIVHQVDVAELGDLAPRGCSLHEIAVSAAPSDPLHVLARNEGRWGDRLTIELEVSTSPVLADVDGPIGRDGLLVLLDRSGRRNGLPAIAELLRLYPADDRQPAVDAFVTAVATTGAQAEVTLSGPPLPPGTPIARVERVEATLRIDDADPRLPRVERFERLGFHPGHPRHLVRAVDDGSELVRFFRPDRDLIVDAPGSLVGLSVRSRPVNGAGGEDRNGLVTLKDICDADRAVVGSFPEDGVFSLARAGHSPSRPGLTQQLVDAERNAKVAMLVVPDLHPVSAGTALEADPAPTAGASFADCVAPVRSAPVARSAMPEPASDEAIVATQEALVRFAEEQRQFVVLLDCPPAASIRQVQRWRERFDSTFAAAYHPWVDIAVRQSQDGPRTQLTPPSAVAAGIIAERELRLGIPWGPANEHVVGGVDLARAVSSDEHDLLHRDGVNVLRPDPQGIVLSAARTLARDTSFRQLSVRRLMTLIAIVLEEQSQWVVFEPNNPALRRWLRYSVEAFLEDLFDGGAFVGATPAEAFFVRTGEDADARARYDRGELVVEVGVAPAEPVEYLVVRIAADEDGLMRVEELDA